MAPRANWKGFLQVGEVSCAVALYTAASTSDRIAFNTLNRATLHRVRRQFIDSETEQPVEKDDQVKGYETAKGDYIVLEPDEIAALTPQSDKLLAISAFLGCADIDSVYFDKPYYLSPADQAANQAFGLINRGMQQSKTAAIARTLLFRRLRTLLIRPEGDGMIANTLKFDYEVRPAQDAFHDVKTFKIKDEMLDLAKHIIKTKQGHFNPEKFDDRYETAIAELVKAKLSGKKLAPPRQKPTAAGTDLMAALRASAR